MGLTIEPPETRTRRLLELNLLQHYFVMLTSVSDGNFRNNAPEKSWSFQSTKIVTQFPNLLYASLSMAATNLLQTHPDRMDLKSARETYLNLALREQHHAVTELSRRNADAVCYSSLFMLLTSFAMLGERSQTPYTPPTDWLRLGRGAKGVFETSLHQIQDYDPSKILLAVNGPPVLYSEEELFSAENLEACEGFLLATNPSIHEAIERESQIQSPQTRLAYQNTLAYLGSIILSVQQSEPLYSLSRRIIVFGIHVPVTFIECLEAKEPLALVIMAHYFALIHGARSLWYLGDTARKEVESINDNIPASWQATMMWPLSVCRGSTSSPRISN